ncbi:hypothetical protein BUALT_Bualt17G0056400 [Buddleja alternifolia]|uniref:Late embryogenesis abundant protein LEA-2 subgroup domain-containing protein n=1 Tax=Buddleja alternifolia TaxID=168488 RepID=A0AAV6WBW9_9LAMI|nr:hypothetical protein BUALT_Bualt17G0056400 [Buddleja alternifolia]
MDENVSPRRPTGPDGYNRLSTFETEDQTNTAITTTTEESNSVSEFRQFLSDLHHQMELGCQDIDWDRIFMTTFVTISLFLIIFAFLPYLQTQLIAEEQFQHEFSLFSLSISEFQASQDQVTGKCEIMLNITNPGDRSIYHETSVLSIFLDHELLWVTRTSDFFIDVGSSIMFNVNINKTTVSVPASFVPTALLESRELHKPLHFKLKYDGMLREGLAAWYEERSHVYVVCGWIEMQFTNETSLKGGPANCTMENY